MVRTLGKGGISVSVSSLEFRSVTKQYPDGGGIREFSCSIAQGEFFVFLGPSGCGKTTLLRLAAGLETPDTGRVYMDGMDVTDMPAEERNAAMVFQSYALFPHMSVFENVAFGLRARRMPKKDIQTRVRECLALVQLEGFERRRVTELSGGQQQRVALARALAIQPRILLLDEPLSNLDAELRYSMRIQLTALQERLGITTVYVTHDQEEAFELADRIAILKNGVCEQIAAPQTLMDQPATPFVEQFLARRKTHKTG